MEVLREETALTDEDTQAQKLCKQYNIHVDYLNNENIISQVSSFCVNDGAFLQFKKSATIDRTLKNYNQYLERAQLQKLRDKKNDLEMQTPSPKKIRARKTAEPAQMFNESVPEYTNQYFPVQSKEIQAVHLQNERFK